MPRPSGPFRSRAVLRLLVLLLPLAALPVVLAGAPAGAVDRPAGLASAFARLTGFSVSARDAEGHRAVVRPRSYAAYGVDLGRVRDVLRTAPQEGAARGLEIALPDPTGVLQRFSVVEDSVLEPGLAAAHPELTTYAGRSLDGTPRSIRLDVGPLGVHASVRTLGGGASWYVDPAYVERDPSAHLSYFGAAVPASSDTFVERDLADTERILDAAPQRVAPGALVSRRTFRLAFVTDPTFSAYYGSRELALAAKTAIVNRADQVYDDDLAIRFVLIDGTDKLTFATRAEATEPDGPCGASACYDADAFYADGTDGDTPDGCTSALLDRNSFVLGQLVGADRFDIGHIGLGVNGGGIAGLGVVGGASKAQGCTGLPKPTGDFYAVDYFAHEIGHQMGGNHTFNGTQVNCAGGNRNAGTSVEPGSGTSVMAYAGICGQDNLQPHSDPYFSQRSIDEIDAVTTATPASLDEVQTVSLEGFDTDGDSIQLGYPGKSAVTLTRGPLSYNHLTVTAAVAQLTGCVALVTDYDDTVTPTVSDDGFTVSFSLPTCSGTDLERLTVTPGTGGATGFVGVQTDGGDGTNQGTSAPTTNHAPTVSAGADKTIPLRTPFTLAGSATDVDAGDTGRLVYLWEQDDEGGGDPLGLTGGTALVSETKTDGPLFRVFGTYADVDSAETLQYHSPGENLATTSGSRTFPDLAQVVAGNTNAATGTCPTAPAVPDPPTGASNVPVDTVECFAEWLPTADYGNALAGRALHFRLTARDLYPTGGGVQHDDLTLTLDSAAGPFLVTSRPTTGTTAQGGTTETVTWAVNGTDDATLAPQVRISLSTDGGRTFPTVLATSTANDGSETVLLPDVATTQARIKVEAVDNYFFDVNDADFTIASSAPPGTTPGTPPGTTPGTPPGTTPGTPPGTTPGTNPGTTPTAGPVTTRTRIRLPRVEQVRGRSTRLRYQVVAADPSTGTAGSAVVRIDGRKVSKAPIAVTRKQGTTVVGPVFRIPAGLALGRHTIRVVFKPSSGAYGSSVSRTVTLTVVARR